MPCVLWNIMSELGTCGRACPAPPERQWYQFFDVLLALSARRSEFLTDFARVYGAHRVPEAASPSSVPLPALTCHLDTDESGRGWVTLDNVRHAVADRSPDGAYARSLIIEGVAARSHTHLFLHATAASAGERTLLLVGPSGYGKSTLGQALADRGVKVVCDDVAPLEIAVGTVSSFPRCCSSPRPSGWAPVVAVFLLHTPPHRRSLHLALDCLPAEWEQAPPWGEQTPVTIRRAESYWELVARDLTPGTVERIAETCRKAGVVVLRDLGLADAEFREAPHLTRRERAVGLPALTTHLMGRSGRPLTELAWQLASSLRQARLWDLEVGSPRETAEAILRALDEFSDGSL